MGFTGGIARFWFGFGSVRFIVVEGCGGEFDLVSCLVVGVVNREFKWRRGFRSVSEVSVSGVDFLRFLVVCEGGSSV